MNRGQQICNFIYSFMININIPNQVQNVLKQGFMQKQSRFLKSWRKRWFVLTPQTLMTFKQRQAYTQPTEVILLKDITSIKSCDEESEKEFTFKVSNSEADFVIAASSTAQKQQWINQIGKAMVKINSKGDDND